MHINSTGPYETCNESATGRESALRLCQVRDAASEELRRARGKVATITGRLRGTLKGQGGEATEQAGPRTAMSLLCALMCDVSVTQYNEENQRLCAHYDHDKHGVARD